LKTTLIIATYNWPEALELVLINILKQSIFPDEIIIADDGSTKETKQLINHYSSKFHSGIKHIWQEDNGFQKTIILNKAIAKAKGEYIIQIDGDILLHKHFIKDHINISQQGSFIHGSRVFLNKEITRKAISNSIFQFSLFNSGIQNRFNGLYSSFLSTLISSKNNNLKGTRGCNFSFWKQDFINANGYNEDMIGWGKEDTELSVRLINTGLIKHKVKNRAICYHLHHKISSRKGLNINNTILDLAIQSKNKRCSNGVDKYAN
jgi:glycosyltransferase involved in cell wall biosynthesis